MILALVEDKDLIFRFVAVFSRFEYALKRMEFLKKEEQAEVDWDAYAEPASRPVCCCGGASVQDSV